MAFIGDVKTGKTSLMFELARDWKKAKPKDFTVFGYDHHGNKKDVIDINIIPSQENWDEALPRLRNSLIILDEKRFLHTEDRLKENWGLMLGDFMNRNNDIMFAVHNPKLILEKFTYFITHYYIFYTNSKEGGFKDKIPNYTKAYTASVFINKYVSLYGKGTYPNLPFVEVNNLTGDVNAYHIYNNFEP